MKNLIKLTTLILLSGVLFSSATAGDKEFSGIIIYNITYENSDLDPQMLAMMPKTLKIKIKGEKVLTEISMGMGKTVTVYDAETNTGLTFMDMMGQKYAMKMTSNDFNKEIANGPEVEVITTDETMEVAGYMCKKATVKILDGDMKDSEHIVYFTDELGSGMVNKIDPMYKDINGIMLDYKMVEDGMTMKLSAISVEKKKLSDADFEIPEGYNIMSKSDFENMFGGH
ncbi:MAG: hypothetical protein R2750_01195 [Bacteroidales bacterium]